MLDNFVYSRFCEFLENRCGIVLGDSKQYLVRSRLMPLLKQVGHDDLNKLIESVVQGHDRQLMTQVIDAMTTNETLWFRDQYPFTLLTDVLLPKFENLSRPVRIWSAACSSGQEPYSIAMCVHEYKQKRPGALRAGVEIVATDISNKMLAHCQRGEYDELSLGRGLSDERKRQFFESTSNGGMRVISSVRNMVQFRSLNLLESYAGMGRFDIVFCRNVLIYFSAANKTKILQQIAASLPTDGILFLGASESLSGLSDQFTLHRCSPGLYFTKKQ